MKLSTVLISSFLVAASSAQTLRVGAEPEDAQHRDLKEHLEERRREFDARYLSAVKRRANTHYEHVVQWDLRLDVDETEFDPDTTFCTDPFHSETSDIPFFDFVRVATETIAHDWLVSHGHENAVWHLNPTPLSSGPVNDRRQLLMNFNYRIAGTCYWCDPDDTDNRRRLGSSEGKGSKLSDKVAKGLKKAIRKECGQKIRKVELNLV